MEIVSERPTWTATWTAGPALTPTVALGPGRHTVGRSPLADVRADDPALAPFELCLVLHDDGAVETLQLAGCRDAIASVGQSDVDLAIGSSTLRVERVAPDAPRAQKLVTRQEGGRCLVVRAPRAIPRWEPQPLDVPLADGAASADRAGGSLIPALVALGGSGVVAVVLSQPLFLLFGAVGALAAIASWVVQRAGGLRRRRRAAREAREALSRFTAGLTAQRTLRGAHHIAAVGTLPRALTDLAERSAAVWSRRCHEPDAFLVSLGLGDVSWEPTIAGDVGRLPPTVWATIECASTLRGVAVPLDLTETPRVAIAGSLAASVARGVIAQLAVQCGPADWHLTVVAAEPSRWRSAAALPHGAGSTVLDEDTLADLLRADAAPSAHARRVVVADGAHLLSARTSPLRRLLAGDPEAIVICVDQETVPSMCTAVLTTASDGRGSWIRDVSTGGLPQPVRVAGLSPRGLASVTDALTGLVDPEDSAAAGSEIPADVSLAGILDAADADGIAAAWRGLDADTRPEAPIGLAGDGPVVVDLVRDGPHALVAGTTGAGKSELLRTLVVGLAARRRPADVSFVLVDYKGGAAFDACMPLPHVVGSVTDLDGGLSERALDSLRAELTRRERLLRERGASDLTALRERAGEPVVPRLVVVVDEFAALAEEQPDFLSSLVGVAQRGRSLGVHLILATQRPAGVVSDDIRANTNLRIALRVQHQADAIDVISDPTPASLPRQIPGRAVMRLGPGELLTFQVARDAERLVPAIRAAWEATGDAAPAPVWLPPLPTRIEARSCPRGIGLADLVAEQRQVPFTWRASDGHVLVVGAVGSGVTSTLLTAALADPDGSSLLVVDASGDERWSDVARHARVAAVARPEDRELLTRVLATATRADGSRRLLVVDGLGALRSELDRPALAGLHAEWERLLADPPAGVTLLFGCESVAAVPHSLLTRVPNRWIHHLADAASAGVLGLAPARAPAAIPGRLVTVRGRSSVEVQMVAPAPPEWSPSESTARIGRLPCDVSAAGLAPASCADGVLSLPIGLRFDSLTTAVLEVGDGEHVLVLGPARSGRSTTLARLHAAWRELHPDGWCGVVAPRRSPLRQLAGAIEVPPTGPALLVVDDAELVDDSDGSLLRAVTRGRAGLLVVAAARPEALRQSYGHWTTAVRRSRLGILLAGVTDIDADLLAAPLPRWCPLEPRPGLAHLVADGTTTLIQIAREPAVPSGEAQHLAAVS